MTPLGQFLAQRMAREGIDAKTLSLRLGVDQAVLSRLIHGQRRTCSERTIRRLVAGCADPRDQAECLAAYLRGQLYPPFDRIIRLRLFTSG